MKKTTFLTFLVVCLLVCQQLTCQVTPSQLRQSTNSGDYRLLDVKVTTFLFKKVDTNNSIIPFTHEDVDFLENYLSQKKGVISVKTNPIDKKIEVISLLQKEGKILFQHRQIIELLQQKGYIATQMHCERQQKYLRIKHNHQNNQTVTL